MKKQNIPERNRIREIVKHLDIMDDALFQKMAEDTGFCEEMISTILGRKVAVKRVVPQNSVKNLQGRSVVLDVLCELDGGRLCTVEVQKADDDNHEKRVRYNASCVTANVTEPGTKFENVPDVIVIYISRSDIFKSNKTVYHVDRVIRETGEMVYNGLMEVYVNAKVDDGSDVARMMKIFSNKDAYDDGKFPKVSGRKRQFMEDSGGEEKMCDLIENYAKEYAGKVAADSAVRLFENGADYNLVRSSIVGLSDEELAALYVKATGKAPAAGA